ncbi:MAG: hypothetical protein JOZ73_06065 [Solirubrobacterales bacterium]|nr:hypothetical protein [Solirubrobacterales bacterium]
MPPTRLRSQASQVALSPHELAELFAVLGRLKTSLSAAVDQRLRREHDLPLATFDAMKTIGRSADGCHSDDLAQSLAVSPHEADLIIDALVAAGRAFRKPRPGASGAGPVALTLSGALVLERAGQTVERVLHAHLDPMLSPSDQRLLEESLRALRPRRASHTTNGVAEARGASVP